MIRANRGWDMFKMFEVEKYPCKDRREAEKKEDEVMKELKANMNTNRSFTSEKESKENIKEYRKDNEQKIKEY